MNDVTEMRHSADSILRVNSLRVCKSPRPDSWVWDVPTFRTYTSDEDINDLQNQEELMMEVESFLSGHRHVVILISSILFGLVASLASLALGYSYIIATLAYALGGFCGFVFVAATNFLQFKVD